jgi:methylenetetrahydrofolate dehydrogenase (NADP+)/methenyltetrahydrofolate cyclohydrolase
MPSITSPSSTIIDGRAIAAQILGELTSRVGELKKRGKTPGLAFVRVGEDAASKVYVGRKEKTCAELGIISESKIYSAVLPEKDVDGFHPVNVGKLMLGDASGFRPCTPAGIVELLARSEVRTDGAEVIVLGRGNIVGKPMAAMLCQKGKNANATVTICHSATRDIKSHCLRADILIAAMGVPEFVKADMVKPSAVVIDVGVNRVDGKIVGDVDFAEVQKIAGKITPNPGGVGPMTIAMLMQNTVRAAENSGN